MRLQVEVMALRVEENLRRMHEVLRTGDETLAETMLCADDEIDAMNISLMERCYSLLRVEAPLAGDLRLVVSVLRILSELERIGDLTLRIAKSAPDHAVVRSSPKSYELLVEMAGIATERFQLAVRAWATMDLAPAVELAQSSAMIEPLQARLVEELTRLEGGDAAHVAIVASSIGRTLDRIADHAVIIGARVRYLLTGDAAHLAAEVR